MTENESAIIAAALSFADVFGPNCDMLDDTARSLGCGEAEAFAEILRVTGHVDSAAMFIRGHAEGDEDGYDFHCRNCAAFLFDTESGHTCVEAVIA